MKVGVIGAGAWGRNLVRNFAELGVLAGVADPVAANRAAAAEICPAAGLFEHHTDLLGAGIDAVAIATPVPSHYRIACEALEAGMDLFIEKPMTLSPEDAEDLIARAEQKGKILMVGHLLLYQPAVRFLSEFLAAGKLGRLSSMHQRRSKHGRARAVENVLWSFGVHDIAVLLHLAGEAPCSVQAVGHAGVTRGVEDDVYLHLGFANGLVAHLHNSWLWPKVERGLIVVGEKGMLEYDEINQEVILHRKTINSHLANIDEGAEVIFRGDGQPLRLELEHFLDCCRERLRPLSDGHNGLEVVRVLDQAQALLTKIEGGREYE
jgi:predicted dehydrogenase